MTAPVRPLVGGARLLRVGVLGGSGLLLATLAHTIGGGRLPGPAVLLVTGFLVGLVALVATARRVRFPVLLGGLALEQVLLHLVLDAAAASAGCTPVAMVHHAMTQLGCGPGHAMGPSGGWSMLVAHALATLVTAWLLARGEAWWWRAADAVARAAGTVPTSSRTPRRPRTATPVPYRQVLLRRTDPAAPRGPPLVLV